MKGMILGLLLLLWGLPALAFDHQYKAYNRLLQEVVLIKGNQTGIKYQLLKNNPKGLQALVKEIEGVPRAEFEAWSSERQMAFLINAYNALTLKLILTRYPDLKSIKDLGSLFQSPWKIKFFQLFGQPQDLDHIEHDLLRAKYQEPRIHFAIVCASKGCPPLWNEAFQEDKLERQLHRATVNFLSDPQRNRLRPAAKRVELSPIFKWFQEDFAKKAGKLEAFLAPYLAHSEQVKADLLAGLYDFDYLDYDWRLNDALHL